MSLVNDTSPSDEPHTAIDLPAVVAFLRRRAWIIALGVVVAVAIGALYAFTAQPKYAAIAGLVIDDPQADAGRLATTLAPSAEDLVAIETQMQIIRSQDVALSVVDRLDLVENPLFIPDRPDVITGAIGAARATARNLVDGLSAEPGAAGEAEDEPTTPRERAALAVRQDLSVYRVGSSRAIDVLYEGNHPDLAAAIANAVTEAYVENRLEARFNAAENASAWLRERIGDLQARFSETARQVQAFRAENEIVDAGGGRGLINQQALAEVNQSLVAAATAAAEASARYEAVSRALASEDLSYEGLDGGASDLVSQLRSRLVELRSQEAALAARLAPGSPALDQAARDVARAEEAIRDELGRIAARLQSEQEIAERREADLRADLASLVERSNVTEEARVRVQQLESEAEVLRAAYESYLQRYTEVIQQQSAPFLQARTISPALVPTGPTSPRRTLVLALAIVLGGGLGLAIAVLVESLDRSVRLPRHLEQAGVRCLGVVPKVRAIGKAFTGGRRAGPLVSARQERGAEAELAFATSAPTSPFANALRRVRASLARAMPEARGSVIGVTALSPGEGVTTVAGNLGRLFAAGGASTLVVDANLHDRLLSRVAHPEENGRRYALLDACALLDLLRDPQENQEDLSGGIDRLASERMRAFLDEARSRHDVVVLDLPALESVPDTTVLAPLLDGVVLVSAWGRTPRPALAEAAAHLSANGAVVLGGVLNKARLRAMRLHGHRATDLGYATGRQGAA